MNMINWLHRHHQLDRLERDLREVDSKLRPLSKVRRAQLKERVMIRIDEAMTQEEVSFEELAAELDKLTLMVEPTRKFKLNARRDLLDVLSLRTQRVWMGDLLRDLVGQRRRWATVVAGLVLFVSTFGYMNQLPRVSAAKVSAVTSVRGEVFVQRAGEQLVVEDGFFIQPGDILNTSGDAWVDVLFVDDSLVTLGPDTIVEITQLWNDPNNIAKTSIELDVQRGRVWSSVVNLLSNGSSFALTSGDAEFFVKRRAVFDLFVSEEDVTLRVFKQLVNFNIEEGSLVQSGTLGPNLMLNLEGETLLIEQIEDIETLKLQDVWIQTNLQNGSNHLTRLEHFYDEQNRQRAGILPGDISYVAERAFEDIQLFLTFDDDVRSQRSLIIAENRFSEAAVLLQAGEVELAEEALKDYQSILLEISEDYSYAMVQPLLEENKKTLETVAADAEVKDLRTAVEETSVLVAGDDATRSVLQLDTVADRLALALDFMEIGAYDLAVAALEDYQVGLSGVIDGLPDLEMESRKEVVLEILDQKLIDLQMLKLIELELLVLTNGEVEAGEAVQDQVTLVYEDTLSQLNQLVLNVKERAVLELGNFLEDVKGDEELQLEVLNRLKKSVELEFGFIQLINDIESFYADDGEGVLILDNSLITPSNVPVGDYEQIEGDSLPQDQEVSEA